jgi:hypothetical protein
MLQCTNAYGEGMYNLRFEVLTAVRMTMLFFWVVTPCSPEDGNSMFLRNVGIYLRVYTASQPRTTTSLMYNSITMIIIIINMHVCIKYPLVSGYYSTNCITYILYGFSVPHVM